MRRALEAFIALLCLSLTAVAVFMIVASAKLEAENASLKRSVRTLTDQAAQMRLAREVERARSARMIARNADLNAALATLQNGGVPNAMLDPDLAALVNRVQSDN